MVPIRTIVVCATSCTDGSGLRIEVAEVDAGGNTAWVHPPNASSSVGAASMIVLKIRCSISSIHPLHMVSLL